MARSMTGYGASARDGERARVRIELRSLNHRFLEVSLNLPPFLNPHEAELRNRVAARVKRARVDVWIDVNPREEPAFRVRIHRGLLAEIHRQLEAARHQLGIPGEVSVEVLTRFPEAVRIEPEGEALDLGSLDTVHGCLDEALAALDRSRSAEGEVLVSDIAGRIETLAQLVESAAKSVEAEPARLQERLRERVTALLGDSKLDPERLHQEIAFLAERADVTEELVRLRMHLERARAILREEEPGKPLDFLLQELGREVNTLGSKSRAPETAGAVLAMKAELEKIREQARNLE